MKEYIGIIGGNGYVGKNVVLALQKLENNKKILATTRKTAEGMNDQTLEYVHLDINNLEQLKLFCSNCSTIINCVGPSFIIGDKIAKACLHTGTNYVEVSGDSELCTKLETFDDLFQKKSITCIHSAGVNPGLVEALTNLCIMRHGDIEIIEVYFAGTGELSYNAAIDMIESCKSPYSRGSTFLEEGNYRRITNFEYSKVLPDPSGKVFCVPVISNHFARCIKKCQMKKAFFYNVFRTAKPISIMFDAGNSSTNLTTKDLSSKLRNSFIQEKLLYGKEFTAIYFSMYGRENLTKKMVYYGNWNELTGITAAIVALGIEKGKIMQHSIGEIWNTLDMKWFYEKLVEIKKIELDL